MKDITISASDLPTIREALGQAMEKIKTAPDPDLTPIYDDLRIALDTLEQESSVTVSREVFVALTSVVQSTNAMSLADQMRRIASSLGPDEAVVLKQGNE